MNNCWKNIVSPFPSSLGNESAFLPTTYQPRYRPRYRPHTDHILTTYWPHTDHILTTYRPRTDHVPTTYRPHTDRLYRPHTNSSTCFILPIGTLQMSFISQFTLAISQYQKDLHLNIMYNQSCCLYTENGGGFPAIDNVYAVENNHGSIIYQPGLCKSALDHWSEPRYNISGGDDWAEWG